MATADELQTLAISNQQSAVANLIGFVTDLGTQAGLYKNGIGQPSWTPPSLGAVTVPPVGIISTAGAPGAVGVSYVDPGSPGSAPDALALYNAAYASAPPAMVASIQTAIDNCIAAYFPGYFAELNTLDALLTEGANETPVSPSDSASFIAQLEQGIFADRQKAQDALGREPARGFETWQQGWSGNLAMIEQNTQSEMARARTAIAVRLFEITVDFRKFSLGALAGLNDSMRSGFLNIAGIRAGLWNNTQAYATGTGTMAADGYRLTLDEYTGLREAAKTPVEMAIEEKKMEIEVWASKIRAEIDAANLQIANISVQLKQAEIPYRGALELQMEKCRQYVALGDAILQVFASMGHAWAGIAGADSAGLMAGSFINETTSS